MEPFVLKHELQGIITLFKLLNNCAFSQTHLKNLPSIVLGRLKVLRKSFLTNKICCLQHNQQYQFHQIFKEIIIRERAYIKYVGGGAGGFDKFFKTFFVVQETKDLDISWPSNFFRKYFMSSPIKFRFLFKAYLQQYFRVVFSNIQISNHRRS